MEFCGLLLQALPSLLSSLVPLLLFSPPPSFPFPFTLATQAKERPKGLTNLIEKELRQNIAGD